MLLDSIGCDLIQSIERLAEERANGVNINVRQSERLEGVGRADDLRAEIGARTRFQSRARQASRSACDLPGRPIAVGLGRDGSEPWLETDIFDTGERPEPFLRWRVAGREVVEPGTGPDL